MLRRGQAGISIIEVMVTVTIATVLLAWGAPSFSTWMQNTRTRSTAESVLSGVQSAKAEAVSRNGLVRFQLTTTLTSACVLGINGPNWVINIDPNPGNLVNNCDKDPSETLAPFIIRKHDNSSQGTTAIAAGVSSLVFNGLGKVTPLQAGNTNIDITPANNSQCASAGGTMTCLRIVVSPSGQIRMCNTKFSAPDPQACP